jgi:class 3 adenylate cyclase
MGGTRSASSVATIAARKYDEVQSARGAAIRYARTRDGVDIAFWAMGEGGIPLIVGPPLDWSHVSDELLIPDLRSWYERLARDAITCASACHTAVDAPGLTLHVGIHAGDVIREQNNVYGGAVNVAACISALAGPGDILVPDIVRSPARTSAGVTFEDRGEHGLKGIADEVRVYAVRRDGG